MANKCKMLFVTTALTVLLPAGGGAYANPLFIVSPQKDATAARFTSSADDFISVRNYAGLDFNKWFGVVSFRGNMPEANYPSNKKYTTDMAQFGFATRFGSVYTGLYYGGNALTNLGKGLSNSNIFNYSEQEVDGKTMRVYNVFPKLETSRDYLIRNEAAVLIGVADMGFRLSYLTSHQSIRIDEDFAVNTNGTTTLYKSFRTDFGYINPELAWGMTRELIPGIGLKPELKVDVNLFRNYEKNEQYDSSGSSNGPEIVLSGNTLTLGINAVLGGFSLKKINDFNLSADFEYGYKLKFGVDNEFSYRDANNKYQAKKFKGLIRNSKQYGDDVDNIHTFIPSISASWHGGGLSLSSRLGVELTASFLQQTTLGLKKGGEGDLVKDGQAVTINTFTVTPALDLGMIWSIVPDRLNLNMGGKLAFGAPSFTVRNEKWYDQGEEDASKAQKIIQDNFTNGGATTKLFLGVTVSPIKNIALQAVCGVDTGNSISLFNINTTGFLYFANILATVQF